MNGKQIVLIIAAVVIIVLGIKSYEQIDLGKEGVVYNLNGGIEMDNSLAPGVNWLNPITESVVTQLSTQNQKLSVESKASTKDIQPIDSQITLNFHLAKGMAPWVHQNLGDNYVSNILEPRLQSVYKDTTGTFPITDIIDKRVIVERDVEKNMRTAIKSIVQSYGYKGASDVIIIDSFSLVDIGLDPGFQDSVKAKQVAEQNVQTAKWKLQQIEVERNQTIAEAQGKAEAMRIQAEALEKNQNLVSWEAVKKWNGVMPQYWLGGGNQNSAMLFNIPNPASAVNSSR